MIQSDGMLSRVRIPHHPKPVKSAYRRLVFRLWCP